MLRKFSISSEKKFSKQAVWTLTNHAVYQFANSLSLIFINLYLWRLTNSLLINGLFNLFTLLSAPIGTMLMGRFAKQKDRLVVYRYGILLTAIFYLCILITQEKMVDYFYIFAILKGISTAFYWLGYFTLMFDVSNNQNRHRYLGWNLILTHIATLVGPIAAGTIISQSDALSGYSLVFMIAFSLFLMAAVGSFKMDKSELHHKKYYMKYLPLMLKKRPTLLKTLLGWFIIGFPQGILMYIPSILLFDVIQDEGYIGSLNAVFLAISILSSYTITRIAKIEFTKMYLLIAGLGFTFASMFVVWELSIYTLILFMSVHAVFKPLQANSYAAHYYQWIGELPLKQHFRVESIVIRETIINMGRALGVFIFMMLSQELNSVSLPWVLCFVLMFQLIIPSLVEGPYFLKKGVDFHDKNRRVGGSG
ncbi:MFS transporter [Chengkuizengella axinellae]|uniref:MFS transporter n=1 Tax=Chengkuizengella axinellae TaxID=3064388 RepID=A0ABT9IUR8_9BACL|nr:MFS transporter [Chengkuizengella sp. 2205SS18-9]MDP5272609.1 MFS transporter [Chengkuizengella sp. 2205SS18-9]